MGSTEKAQATANRGHVDFMGQMIRYDNGTMNGIIKLPVEFTVELLNALLTEDAALAAVSYGTRWLADKLRKGQNRAIYECRGVTVIARLKEDSDGWLVLIEPYAPDSYKPKGAGE